MDMFLARGMGRPVPRTALGPAALPRATGCATLRTDWFRFDGCEADNGGRLFRLAMCSVALDVAAAMIGSIADVSAARLGGDEGRAE